MLHRYTPQPPNPPVWCHWSFFQCSLSPDICRSRHSACLAGDDCEAPHPGPVTPPSVTVDNKICSGVARDPQRYLVPHPTDCTKFYSCRRRGWGGWLATPMDCPITTGFDKELMICNYAKSLPR